MDNNNYDNYDNGNGDYLSPELENRAPYGDDPYAGSYDNGQYENMNGSYDNSRFTSANGTYDNNQYGDMNGTYDNNQNWNMNGSYDSNQFGNQSWNMNGAYDNTFDRYYAGMPGGQPVGKNGKPIPNHFAMKMVFSIIEIFISFIFGILALVFTVQQDTAYKNGDWERFKKKKTLSTVMLWIGLVAGITTIVLYCAVWARTFSKQQEELRNLYNSASDGSDAYDSDGYYYDDTDSADGTKSKYPTGDSTLVLDETESLTVNGASVTVPMDVKSFVSATGISTEDDLETTQIEAEYDELMYIAGNDGVYSMIDVYNTSSEDDFGINGYVGGLLLDYGSGETMPFEWRGITQDSSIDDMYSILGTPDEATDYSETTEFTYYAGPGWVTFEFDNDGRMSEFWLSDYESLQ